MKMEGGRLKLSREEVGGARQQGPELGQIRQSRGQNPHPCLKTKKSTNANNYFVMKMRFLDTDNYLIGVYLTLEKIFQINH